MAGYCPQQGEPERNKSSAPSGIGWKPTPVIENPLKRVAIGLRTGFLLVFPVSDTDFNQRLEMPLPLAIIGIWLLLRTPSRPVVVETPPLPTAEARSD